MNFLIAQQPYCNECGDKYEPIKIDLFMKVFWFGVYELFLLDLICKIKTPAFFNSPVLLNSI